PGNTELARSRDSSCAMPSTGPPARLAPTRTAPGSTRRPSRCRWCCSSVTAGGCTASAPRRKPQTGSSCRLLVSDATANLLCGLASVESWVCPLTVCLSLSEPLSKPEIMGNSSVKAGDDTKLVCNVLKGKADLYWWKKNGELLLGSERIQFEDNSTLCIVRVSMSDSGYYACVVRNAVSHNETSFLLKVHREWGLLPPAR
ncbi:HECAM protein, partial [Piprites chloris]|nr:HECAM protein [Piprites chloris]